LSVCIVVFFPYVGAENFKFYFITTSTEALNDKQKSFQEKLDNQENILISSNKELCSKQF